MTRPLSPPHTPRAWRRYDRQPPVPERNIHIMVADTLKRFVKPHRWQWTHIPSGEYRTKQTAGLLERMGVRPGWPDFILINWTGAVYFLELKSEKGFLSEHQQAFFAAMRARGIECAVARSYDEAIKILAGWGVVNAAIEFK
jgi:VRR-NUC domain